MSFGEKVLTKYGWKKGDGLGKQNDGIKEAIKPKLKANNLGLGFKLGAEFQDNWWENVFNQAAANVNVKGDEDGEAGQVGGTEEYLPHKKKKCKRSIRDEYSTFQKEDIQKKSARTREAEMDPQESGETDLFHKCGRRTAHKGARHGLSLSGKLERLEKHEREYLDAVKRKKRRE